MWSPSIMTSTAMTRIRHQLLKPIVLKVLLTCGILALLLYASTDILAGALYAGYSFTSQAISELFAIGAPTSHLVVPLFTVYDVLLVAFALGVWVSAGRNRALRVIALMVVGNAANGLVLWNFFPTPHHKSGRT
jgi:voltage-gated potassium channel Kch